MRCASASVAGAVSLSAHGPRPVNASSVPFHASAVTASLAGSPVHAAVRRRVEAEFAAVERERDRVRGERARDPRAPARRRRPKACAHRWRSTSSSERAPRDRAGRSPKVRSSVRVERADRDAAAKLQSGAARDEIEAGRRRRAGRLRLDMKLPRERARDAAGKSGTSSASSRASNASVIRSPAAPRLPFATSVARPTLRSIAASCTRRGSTCAARRARRVPSPRAGCRARARPTPRPATRDEERPVALTSASSEPAGYAPKRAGSSFVAAASTRERAPSVAIDAAGDENVARTRACAESLDTTMARSSNAIANSTLIPPAMPRSARLPPSTRDRAVEVGVDRSREPRGDESWRELPQVDVAHVEMPVAARRPARRARCGRVRRRGRRLRAPRRSSSKRHRVAPSTRNAPRTCAPACGPYRVGPVSAFAKSTEPARPPFAGFASMVPAIRVDGQRAVPRGEVDVAGLDDERDERHDGERRELSHGPSRALRRRRRRRRER